MVFRTVNIEKRKSRTRQRCYDYDYAFGFNIAKGYEEVLSILQNAMQIFDKHKIYDESRYTVCGKDNKIYVWIKDFPNRKKRKLEKDLKKFLDRLLELTGTLYFFELENTK